MFLLVEFTDNHEIEVIPSNWLDGDSCAVWPTYKSSQKLSKAARCKETPEDDWKSFPIRVLYSNSDYLKTRSKLNIAQDESDLQTDIDDVLHVGKRKKRPNPRFDSSSDDEGPPSKSTNGASKKRSQDDHEPDLPAPPPPPRCQLGSTPPPRCQLGSTPTPQSAPPPRCQVSSTPTSLSAPPPRCQIASTPTSQSAPSPRCQLVSTPILNSEQASTTARPRADIVLRERDIRLFKLLEEIKSEQTSQRILLTNLAAQIGPDQRDCQCPEDVRLPMGTMDDVGCVEGHLQDKAVAKLLVDHISTIGGSSLKIMTKRVLKRIITSGLATNYNWTGAKNKNSFQSLRIASVVMRAVRRNFPMQPYSDTEIVVKDWLRNAKDRDGGRKNRMPSNIVQDSD